MGLFEHRIVLPELEEQHLGRAVGGVETGRGEPQAHRVAGHLHHRELVFRHVEVPALPVEQRDPRRVPAHVLQLFQRGDDEHAGTDRAAERRGEERDDRLMHRLVDGVERGAGDAAALVQPVQVLQDRVVAVQPLPRGAHHRIVAGHPLRGQQAERHTGFELGFRVRRELDQVGPGDDAGRQVVDVDGVDLVVLGRHGTRSAHREGGDVVTQGVLVGVWHGFPPQRPRDVAEPACAARPARRNAVIIRSVTEPD
jgi:hypothetical protein